MSAISSLITAVFNLFKRIPRSLISLLARLSLAVTFLNSFSTKVEGIQIQDLIPTQFDLSKFKIADKTYFLFENVYHVPLLPSSFATVMATTAELVCPVLLILGLATRFSALALLGMTLVIQTFVFGTFQAFVNPHITWIFACLYLMRYGAGKISLDWLLGDRSGDAVTS